VFNKYAYGAYLIHELYPATRVFMDSRNDVYGEKLYGLYLNTLSDAQVAARTFANYAFDYVAIDYQFYPGRSPDRGLLTYLRSRPDEWVLVEFDDESLIYVRDTPEHSELIRRDAYRTLDPTSYEPGKLRAGSAQVRAAFATESSMALDRHPGSRATRLLAAEAAMVAGQDDTALDLYEQVLTADPGDIFALVAAARVALRLGRNDLGLAHYRHALALRPALDELRTELLQAEKREM
jgi:tetratricopeptide (TPR) repeat protein